MAADCSNIGSGESASKTTWKSIGEAAKKAVAEAAAKIGERDG